MSTVASPGSTWSCSGSCAPKWWSESRSAPGTALSGWCPTQINAMLRRFIEHADAIAAEMVRTGGVFQYSFPR